MKHLFYVHSGITYLVSLATIKYLGLEHKDVLLMCARNFVPDKEIYKHLKFTDDENTIAMLPSYGSSDVWTRRRTLKRIDEKIAKAVEGEFVAYLPSDRNYLMQFLQTHPQCVGRNFIEEGLLTYHDGMEKKSKGSTPSILEKAKFLIRAPHHLFRTNVFPLKSSGHEPVVFVVTDTAVKMLSHQKTALVDLRSVMLEKDLTQITNLLILDPVVEMKQCDPAHYYQSLDEFVSNALPKTEMIHVKFHPRQTDLDSCLKIFERHGLSYQILQSKLPLEQLIWSHPDIHAFGLNSSTLFYAQQWGIKTSLFSKMLAARDHAYKNYVLTCFPASIIQSMQLI